MLWLPGGPGLSNYLQPVAQAMAGFRHVLPDPRGTGRSEGGPHDFEVALTDLEDLRSILGIDQWTLVDHSWGADLALAYGLAQTPVISSIVSFAGTGVQNDRDWRAVYQAHRHEEPHGHYDSNPGVQARLLQDWRRFIKSPDLLARLGRLQVPITFLHPANDIRPSWPAQQLADLVPYGRYIELPDAPHEAWLTHQRPLVQMLIKIITEPPSTS